MKKLFIGIDFAKEKFDAAIIEACGLKEFGNREYGTFTNDKRAIDSSSNGSKRMRTSPWRTSGYSVARTPDHVVWD